MQQIENARRKKKASQSEAPLIYKSEMVRVLDCCWNHFIPSLYLLHDKLANLGVVFINDNVVYLGDKEVGDV